MDDLFLDAGPDTDKGGEVPRKRLKKRGGGEDAASAGARGLSGALSGDLV